MDTDFFTTENAKNAKPFRIFWVRAPADETPCAHSTFNIQHSTLNHSEGVPAVTDDDGANDLPPTFQRHRAAMLFQFAARDGVDAIAFAKRGPVHAVSFVQNHFIFIRGTVCPLG